MRLLAIYNVWDDWDLLAHSIKNIKPLVDDVLIIGSELSNSGEFSEIPDWVYKNEWLVEFHVPVDSANQMQFNERQKRNLGLSVARLEGFTHFIMLDSDEMYEPEPFLKEKQRFIDNPDLAGLVCGLKCYFKSPTMCVPDKTLVPFIHKITPDLRFEWNTKYPFAFDGVKREIRIDPTRQVNINSGVEWSDIICHHYSWVRSDIKKKIRNSTARQNIENSTISNDYVMAKPGYYCEFYKATIESCENLFNLPEIIDESINGADSTQIIEPSETADSSGTN